jgi:hypothetical protein
MPNSRWLALALTLGMLGQARGQADQARARALVDRALKALGGADAVAKYPAATWKGKGTFRFGGAVMPCTVEGARSRATRLALTTEAGS